MSQIHPGRRSKASNAVEETEPLGQKIYNADPDPVPDPSYDNSVSNAIRFWNSDFG
ncbi:MAG: hypothetical protein IPJ30_05275 [Acidobacteria bacterium]|nr:hypothetical protein [Acidobacteriota bacterium]